MEQSPMEQLYDLRPDERSFWGDKYAGPTLPYRLPHGEWTFVALYEATHEDGDDAEVYVSAMPARFYRVKGKGIDVTTGSGGQMRDLIHRIATEISMGMLGATEDS